MTVAVSSVQTNCTIDGTGPHLLFLHGWGVGHESYAPLLNHLKKTHTVFAPDLPGFGETPDPQSPWTIEDYSRFILEFISVAKIENPVLMGHSNGGRILLYMLGKNLLSSKKLILLDSAGIKPKRKFGYYFKVYTYKLCKVLLTPFPNIKKKYQSKKGSTDYQKASPVMKGTFKNLVSSYVTELLPGIKSSVLLIWGKDDTATPISDARVMQKLIPDSGIVELPGGHWAFLHELNQTCRVLDSFLGGIAK